jgi:hypothetical protein
VSPTLIQIGCVLSSTRFDGQPVVTEREFEHGVQESHLHRQPEQPLG